MIPAKLLKVPAFPVLPNGKIDRKALPQYTQNLLQSTTNSFLEPSSETERSLVEIWKMCLDVRKISITDHFLALGGDSMRAIAIVFHGRAKGIYFDVQTLYRYPTIQQLASQVRISQGHERKEEPITAFTLLRARDKANLNNYLDLQLIEDAYPATRLQRELLFQSKFQEQGYRVYTTTCRIRGTFELLKFSQALDHIISLHPILRSYVDETSFSEPLVMVKKETSIIVEQFDLSTYEQDEQSVHYAEWLKKTRETKFNWTKAPLLRVSYHRLNTQQYIITFADPWLDGWSMSIIASQLFRYFAALLVDQPPPALNVSHTVQRDFVALELQSLRDNEAQFFWLNHLKDHPGNLFKKSDYRQGGDQISLGGKIADYNGLLHLAKSQNVSVKHVLLAAHLKVLSILGNTRQVVTGIMENGRPEVPNSEHSVGLFLNPMPFCLSLKESSWAELIAQGYETEVSCLRYRRYPVGEIKNALNMARIYDSLFNFINFSQYNVIGNDQFKLEHVDGDDQTYVPLTVVCSVKEKEQIITLFIEADSNVFTSVEVMSLLDCYRRIIASMLVNVKARHENFSAANDQQLELIQGYSGISAPPAMLSAHFLHELFEKNCVIHSQNTAIICGNRTVKYAELNHRANQFAHYLISLHINPGEIVAIAFERSLEFIISILAVLKAGATYLPIDAEYPVDRQKLMLEDSNPALLIVGKNAKPIDAFSGRTIHFNEQEYTEQPDQNPNIAISEEVPAYILYTSGSTSVPKGGIHNGVIPKGVLGTHHGIVNRIEWGANTYPFAPNEVCVQKTSVSFIDSINEIFGPLCHGASLVVIPTNVVKQSSKFADLLRQYGVKRLVLVPSLLQVLLHEQRFNALHDLKYIFVSGEELSPELVRLFKQKMPTSTLINLYGSSEATADVTFFEVNNWDGNSTHVPIGRVIQNASLHILDPWQQPVPVGWEGEIHVGGAPVNNGYLNKPEITARAFKRGTQHNSSDIFYQTGDLGRWLPDGTTEYLGRRDNSQIKIRGHRIEVEEVNIALRQLEGVTEAHSAVRKLDTGAAVLVAFITLKYFNHLSQNDVRDIKTQQLIGALRSKLPSFMIPHNIVVLESFPLLPNGKVNLHALPTPNATATKARQNIVRPEGEIEQKLAVIWAEIFDILPENISTEDDFTALGGDSIYLMSLQTKIEKHFSVRLSLNDLMDNLTIKILAARLEPKNLEMTKNMTRQGIFATAVKATDKQMITESIVEDHILVIQFNDSKHHNPFGAEMRKSIIDGLKRAEANTIIKAVILTGGEGNSFSAGGDFNETEKFKGGPEVAQWNLEVLELHKTVLMLTKPVIAAIDIHAIGMGFQFAVMSDWRIGTPNTKLALTELKNGLSCTLGSAILTNLIGTAYTQRIVYQSQPIPPLEAERMGLLHEVAETGKLMETAINTAKKIAAYAQGPFAHTKKAMSMKMLETLDGAIALTIKACTEAFSEGTPQPHMNKILGDKSKLLRITTSST